VTVNGINDRRHLNKSKIKQRKRKLEV
jgi:hypothetical protein